LRQVSEDWGKGKVIYFFKRGKKEDPGNYEQVILISMPGKMMEQPLLNTIFKNLKNNRVRDKKVIWNSCHGFFKGKSCLTNLMAFYKELTGSTTKERPVDVFTLTSERLSILPSVTSFYTK